MTNEEIKELRKNLFNEIKQIEVLFERNYITENQRFMYIQNLIKDAYGTTYVDRSLDELIDKI